MSVHVGVDVGGTFTDAIAVDAATGRVRIAKVATTPANQAFGFMDAIRALDVSLPQIDWLVHGTTVGTNAALEKRGAKAAMITTKGFRDVVELGRRDRPHTYGLHGTFEPLIPRERRLEVTERMNAFGEVHTPLDEAEVERAIRLLIERGAESLLIAFLHGYANKAHEQRAREIAERLWPNPYVTTSADILGEYREFERFTTASLNAYLQPRIHRYVSRLSDELAQGGVKRELAIMQANGGIASSELAWRRAVGTVLSGPAAGVVAAAHISKAARFANVITCDMGGTSFDVGLIVAGEPVVSNDRELEYNMPVRLPIIDIHTIGAGGGSLAKITAAGILQVGPESAGAQPGPIAFRRGGTRPTVTDANVLLGRLGHENLLGVEGAVDLGALEASFEASIGRPLGIDGFAAAAAVLRVINDKMAGAMRLVTLQRGHDPREFAIFAFGGAGPLHATALARDLGVPKVIVPYLPGIACAQGCLCANVRHDYVQTVGRRVGETSPEEVARILKEQASAGRVALEKDTAAVHRTEVVHQGDLQYEGQTYTLRVDLDPARLALGDLKERLREACLRRFRIDLSEHAVRLVNLRTSVIGVVEPIALASLLALAEPARTAADARVGERRVWFDGAFLSTKVYERHRLPVGARIEGPAILNQTDATTVVEPGNTLEVDPFGNLIITVTP